MLLAASLFASLAAPPAEVPPIAALAAVAIVQEARRARPAEARSHRNDQDFAFRAVRSGEIKSLAEIEARVVPRMRGARYIGSTFDRDSAVYTLKFMREATVIWVEVDGRSGRIVN